MYIYILTLILIILLILTNAITDAPNAIATLVGTKVMPFKKAAKLSAIFNLIGIVAMSFVNISVASCISSMVNLDDGLIGISALGCAMFSVILFALIAMKFGIPTSETHGLVAGLTGSSLALYGANAINWGEWKNVIIGLVWSIIGTYIISKITANICNKTITKCNKKSIQKFQKIGSCGLSFMHGAQDGQKFIGVLVLFLSIIAGTTISENINPMNYVPVILFVAFIMFVGVSIGGKNIVQNIGSDMVKLDNYEAFASDISTVITLFVASMTGLPVSTTHAKTVSIVGIGRANNSLMDGKRILDIMKAWIWTFPVCGGIAYILARVISLLII